MKPPANATDSDTRHKSICFFKKHDSNEHPMLRTIALSNVQSKRAEGVTLTVSKDEAIYYSLSWFLLAFSFNPQIKEDKIDIKMYRGTVDS